MGKRNDENELKEGKESVTKRDKRAEKDDYARSQQKKTS